MSLQDPVADLLTRIRNGQQARKSSVVVSNSKHNVAILKVLVEEGYIAKFDVDSNDNPAKSSIEVELKYYNNAPVIDEIKRVSRPGLRCYKHAKELPSVMGGLGIAVVSTDKGVLSDKAAKSLGLGGEVICTVA